GNRSFLRENGIEVGVWAPGGADGEIGVSRRGHFLGTLRIADTLRPQSKSAVAALKSMGLKTVLLTGDSRTVAERVGKDLGVDEIASELLPTQKVDRVNELLS